MCTECGGRGFESGLWIWTVWIRMLVLYTCMTSGSSLSLSVPQFSDLLNEHNPCKSIRSVLNSGKFPGLTNITVVIIFAVTVLTFFGQF